MTGTWGKTHLYRTLPLIPVLPLPGGRLRLHIKHHPYRRGVELSIRAPLKRAIGRRRSSPPDCPASADWSEIDWKNALWLIPGERMKGRLAQKQSAPDHIVPLSTQALAILENLRQHSGHFQYLFPNVHHRRGAVMSSDTVNRALKIMGYERLQTGHGFRGLASTIMNEHSGSRPDAIERQLAHRDRNKVRVHTTMLNTWQSVMI